jgi:hypothetical protein
MYKYKFTLKSLFPMNDVRGVSLVPCVDFHSQNVPRNAVAIFPLILLFGPGVPV